MFCDLPPLVISHSWLAVRVPPWEVPYGVGDRTGHTGRRFDPDWNETLLNE